MTRLSAAAVADALAAFTVAGLADGRDVESLTEVLLQVRNRVRSSPAVDDLWGQRTAIQRCVQPLVQWLSAEPDVLDLDVHRRVDLLWNLYLATVSRTAAAEAFPLICGNEETWNDTMIELFMPDPLTASTAVRRTRFRLGLPTWCLGMGLLGLVMDQMLASGRWRFYLVLVSTLLVGLSFVLWHYGWSWWSRSTMSASLPVDHAALRPRASSNGPSARPQVPPLEPPPMAPPVPGTGAGSSLATTGGVGGLALGTRVLLNGTGNTEAFRGWRGVVAGSLHGLYDIELESGVRLARIAAEGLTMVPEEHGLGSLGVEIPNGGQVSGSGVYAPHAGDGSNELVKQQAARLRSSLERAHALQSTQPAWGSLFWQAVKNEADIHGLQAVVMKLLSAHGYIGETTVGPPRFEELKRQLTEIEAVGVVPHGTGGAVLQSSAGGFPERMAWRLRLPSDLQRAGPEIYRNIRAEGVASVRQWVNEQHPGLEARNSTQFQDLFTAATIIDFELASCSTEADLMSRLAVSDTLEIQLRKLGSFIYFRRTKDKNGALRMLGIRAPGTNADIAPKWMLDDANLFSKAEYQRMERGQKLNRLEHGGGGGQKGDGKGRKGGGRAGGRGAGKPSKKGGQATQG
eukprot:Skav222679  [mRNA]  locus=scaffold1471:12611:14497:- [translate_table: standard]